MKKIFIVLALFFACSVSAFAYFDVPEGNEYREAISYLKNEGLIGGYADDSFRPNNLVSRAEFLKMALGKTEDFASLVYEEPCFTDVKKEDWFLPYVCYAKEKGIVGGYPDGTFKPNDRVDLAQVSLILSRILKLDLPVAEGAIAWYYPAVKFFADNSYLPFTLEYFGQQITRGELAEILWRVAEEIKDRESIKIEEIKEGTCSEVDAEVPYSVDMERVRAAWLKWTNDARAAGGLGAYTYNGQLARTATVWSELAEDRGYIDHKRSGQAAYYDYAMIKDWFTNQGLTFENWRGITFTENIGYGVYYCNSGDCTDKVIEGMKGVFNFFMAEKGKSYRPHYNSIMSGAFKEIGFGLAVDERSKKFYFTIHYGTKINSTPSAVCGS